MRRQHTVAGFILTIMLILAVAPVPAHAAIEGGPIRKLGRSVTNLLTGWLELPFQVMQTTERSGSLMGATEGFGRGVVFGLGRTLVGAIELITFPIPNPTTRYGPVIEPEFVQFRDVDR
jgi:putative exosortase-associated protein (TIGR04073 family)